MYRYYFIIILCLISINALSQGDLDTSAQLSVQNEYTFAANVYSNGWGLGFSYGKMLNIHNKRLFSTDFAFIKDFKEEKVSNPYVRSYNRFVYGKTHSLLLWRFNYGNLYKLYAKKDQRGVEVRAYYKIGATLGFQKPIYYKIIRNNEILTEKLTNENAHISISDIQKRASFFKGFNELKVYPGIHLKLATSFEFGKYNWITKSLETGITCDVFYKKIELMLNDYNNFYFASLFLSFRIGKVYNPRLKNVNTNK